MNKCTVKNKESRGNMNKLLTRSFQAVARPVAYALDWREPELLIGTDCFIKLPTDLVEKQISRLLIVTDEGIRDSGLLDDFLEGLAAEDITYKIYDKVQPNPTIEICEEIAIAYNSLHADTMLAVGGGSVIDAAKAAGIAIIKPEKPLKSFQGLMTVRKDIPYLIAVPTTAGTGSEGTLAAVITDAKSRKKYTIMDTHLIPDVAVLDANLTRTLPKQLIAGPGMDSLTHAVEAFIGKSNTKETEKFARDAVRLVLENLIETYDNNDNEQARENMLKASYYAGRAFHRAYVGNIHAMSHALSAFYNLPHGQTNATILPLILRLYGESVYEDLAKLSVSAGLFKEEYSDKENAQLFIRKIKEMNDYMGIPSHIPEIKEVDMKALAKHAEEEANPLYPVPVIFNQEDFVQAFKLVKGEEYE